MSDREEAVEGAAAHRGRQQAAAIPYRMGADGHEVLLVTSTGSGDWILPKGNVDPGNTPAEAAEIEAREEAGAIGSIEATAFTSYEYEKGSARLWVQVFPLAVERLLQDWPEGGLRRRRWLSFDAAIGLVERPAVRSVLERFAEHLRSSG